MTEDAKIDFEQLNLYLWDRQFYWGVESEALSSGVWRDIMSVGNHDLYYYCPVESKRSCIVADVAKVMLALVGGPLA